MRLPFNSIRIIPYGRYRGVENMAVDRYLVEWAAENNRPVLRFYGWQPFCLSLGRHQRDGDVDRALLSKEGFDLIRRPTGGSAIFHSGELTYSFVLPRQETMDHHELYEWVHDHLASALQHKGYEVALTRRSADENYLKGGVDVFACFNRKAKSEIHYRGRKVVGSAQKIYRRSILQHGSVMINETHHSILSYLKLSKEQKKEQQRLLMENSVALTTIRSGEVSPHSLAASFTDTLNDYKLIIEELSVGELADSKAFYDEFLIS